MSFFILPPVHCEKLEIKAYGKACGFRDDWNTTRHS